MYATVSYDCSGFQISLGNLFLNGTLGDILIAFTGNFSVFCLYSIPLNRGNQHQCTCILKKMLRKRLINILAKVNVYSRRCSAGASQRTIPCCIVTWTNTKEDQSVLLEKASFPFLYHSCYDGRRYLLLLQYRIDLRHVYLGWSLQL